MRRQLGNAAVLSMHSSSRGLIVLQLVYRLCWVSRHTRLCSSSCLGHLLRHPLVPPAAATALTSMRSLLARMLEPALLAQLLLELAACLAAV